MYHTWDSYRIYGVYWTIRIFKGYVKFPVHLDDYRTCEMYDYSR